MSNPNKKELILIFDFKYRGKGIFQFSLISTRAQLKCLSTKVSDLFGHLRRGLVSFFYRVSYEFLQSSCIYIYKCIFVIGHYEI